MAISIRKPASPDPYARARLLRLAAASCLADFPDADDARLIERMKKVFVGAPALSSECEKALADARADERRRRNERAGHFYVCFILLLLIAMVVWAIFSR